MCSAFKRCALGFALALAGCEEDRGPPAPGLPAAPAPSTRGAGDAGGSTTEPPDPPPLAGDIRAEIDRFTTIDACVAERARLDPVLGDALEAIGYDTFVRDACRVLDAAKAKDRRRCDAIDASSLRSRCQTAVAAISGDPDACPWEIAGKPARGRDGACVAIAARDARLCVSAADARARATCEAIAGHDAAACAKLGTPADRAVCARDAERWRAAIPGSEAGATAFAVEGTLHVEGADAGAPLDVDLAPDLARGVVLIEQRDGARLVVGRLSDASPGFVAPSPYVRAGIGLEIRVIGGPASRTTVARVERSELLLPGRAALQTPAARSTLAAQIVTLGRARGAPVSLTVAGGMDGGGGSWRVQARMTTFVSDVVRAAALAPDLGGDATMR
jgi:hypothetical protein